MKAIISKISRIKSICGPHLAVTTVISIALVAGAYFPVTNLSSHFSKLTKISDGANVCFSRVVQSFTAQMIGATESGFLQKEFLTITEECYGDVLESFRGDFSESFKDIGSKLNKISSEVHWFNERVDTAIIDLSGKNTSKSALLQGRFRKLEESNDSLLSAVEDNKEAIRTEMIVWGGLGVVAWALLIGFAGLDYFSRTRRYRKNIEVNKRASRELEDGVTLTSSKVEYIITQALENNDMDQCATLFTKYHDEVLDGKIQSVIHEARDIEKELRPAVHESTIEKEIIVDPLKKFNLASTIDAVVSQLRSKILSQGVTIEINVAENINVRAKEEAIALAILEMLNYSIKASSLGEKRPHIEIYAKALGGTVLMGIKDSAVYYDKRTLSGVKRKGVVEGLHTSLNLVKEMMGEIEGKLKLSNRKIGTEAQLIFKRAKTEDRNKVARILKGKKKDIQKRIASQT